MKLPYLSSYRNKTKKQIITFGGINYGTKSREGELEESLGLSSDRFPCISQRSGRKAQGIYSSPTGLYARGKLCIVDGTKFLYGGENVGTVSEGEKSFATINTKVVIFPDKKYYDTSLKKFGVLDASYIGYTGDVTFSSGSITVPTQSYIDSAGDEDGKVGLSGSDTISVYTGESFDKSTGVLTMSGGSSGTISALKAGDYIQYECSSRQYKVIVSCVLLSDGTYSIGYIPHEILLHSYPDFSSAFSIGDGLKISGCTSYEKNNGTHIVRSINGRTLTFDDGSFSQTGSESGKVLISREVPDFNCICECDNRIWGAEGTTIYASALGDPKNYFVYDGLSTDSYAAAVGTEGEFTGCVSYASSVLFWKENCVHKILGNYPSQYEIYTYTVPGVQNGSGKSLSVINETLFYKGRNGVYAYSGGTPELISDCFGTRKFFNASAGNDGNKYYISMEDEDGIWGMWVYDTSKGMWLREDGTSAAEFTFVEGYLYYIDKDTGKVMECGQDFSEEGKIPWSATLCRMDETTHGRKEYSKLYLRADLAKGSWFKIEISEDGLPFRQVFSCHDEKEKTVQIPIFPVRCDSFRIRISGKGTCLIRSLVREFSVGSEV